MERTVPQAMLFLLGSGGILVACAAIANPVLSPDIAIGNELGASG